MGDPMGFNENLKKAIYTTFFSDIRIKISSAAINNIIGLLQPMFHTGMR